MLSVSFGELNLKGANKRSFITNIIRRINHAIRKYPVEDTFYQQGKYYIQADKTNFDEMIAAIKKVFGIIYISPCLRTEKNQLSIEEGVLQIVGERDNTMKTFKVETNRVDKRFLPKSPELNKHLGGVILNAFPELSVDVHVPDFKVYVDIKEDAFVYIDRIRGFGGLPIGSSGRGLLLLSGGIDSPVAGFLAAKRGMKISAVHFHSYPYTSKRAEEKVIKLAHEIAEFTGEMTLYVVNILEIQKNINEYCREREMTILTRRFMMRIAEELAKKYFYDVLITGENLGQVASQTIESITVVDASVEKLILRPLITMDKTEIIDIAKTIGTYETSILPYEDCCTVFLPAKPVTKPYLSDIEKSETLLDVDMLVEQALNTIDILEIKIK